MNLDGSLDTGELAVHEGRAAALSLRARRRAVVIRDILIYYILINMYFMYIYI